MPEEF
jgi:importin-5